MTRPFKRTKSKLYFLITLGILVVAVLISSHHLYWLQTKSTLNQKQSQSITTLEKVIPFPVSINPITEVISEPPQLNTFINTELVSNYTPPRRSQNIFAFLAEKIFTHPWYQNIASPVSRTLVIYSGQRTEEVALEFARILRWDAEEVATFQTLTAEVPPLLLNGTLYPGRYLVEKDSSPKMVSDIITKRFDSKIRSRYTPEVEAIVPLADALTIASLIEREAYDFNNMREISGVIWNRLFIDIPLQLDATLQYVRGSEPQENWWPVPRPSDKFLDSPYNTYQNKGLPPTPIANPSIDAIVAALNPINTPCLFYFHDNDGSFFCSETYEEHVNLLKEKFGRGK